MIYKLVLWLSISCLWSATAFSRVYTWKAAVLNTYYGQQWLSIYAQAAGIEISTETKLEDVYQKLVLDNSLQAEKIHHLITQAVKKSKQAARQFGVVRNRSGLSDIELHFIDIACFSLGKVDENGDPVTYSSEPVNKVSIIDEHLISQINSSNTVKNHIRSYLILRNELEIKREIAFLEDDPSYGVSENDLELLDVLFEKVLDGLSITHSSSIYTHAEFEREIKVFWIEADSEGAAINRFFHSVSEKRGLVGKLTHSPSLMVLDRSVAQYREDINVLLLSDRMLYTGKPQQTGMHELRHAYFSHLRAENRDSLHSGDFEKHIVEYLPWHYHDRFSLEELDTWLGDLHYWSTRYSRLIDYRLVLAKEIRNAVAEKALVLKHLSLQTAELSKQLIDGYKEADSKNTKIAYQAIFDPEDLSAPVGIYYHVSNEVASLYYQLLGPEYYQLASDVANKSRGVRVRAETAIIDRLKLIYDYSTDLTQGAKEVVGLLNSQSRPSVRAMQVRNKTLEMKSASNPYVSFSGSQCRSLFK